MAYPVSLLGRSGSPVRRGFPRASLGRELRQGQRRVGGVAAYVGDRAFGVSRWFWTVAGLAMVQAVLASSAETESLEEPRLQFREAFDRWLTWAFAHDRQVHWLG